MAEGLLLVLSAPSGCGKTTIVKRVMATLPGLVFSVSHTTRPARTGEVNGVQYHFVDEAAFIRLRDQQPSGFLEWARVHGNLYGTGVETIHRLQQTGSDVILDIDVQGAAQVQERVPAVTIFIAPPSMHELERRLRGRGTEEDLHVKKRLDNAAAEIASAGTYQYLIVNDHLDEAVETFRSIIIAERSRQRRTLAGQPVQLAC